MATLNFELSAGFTPAKKLYFRFGGHNSVQAISGACFWHYIMLLLNFDPVRAHERINVYVRGRERAGSPM